MRIRNILPFILIVLCFFLVGCASMLSTERDSLSDVGTVSKKSAKTEETEKIDYSSFYIDSTKEESIDADQVFEAIKTSRNERNCTVFFNSLGFDINGDDALVYAKSSALVGDSANENRMLNYIGYEMTEEEVDKAENYSAALTCMREGNYSKAYGLLSKHIDFLDSMQLMNKMIEEELVNYKIGSIGPAGGYIFYDKGFYSYGWRYLEAAPNDLGERYKLGNYYSFRNHGSLGTSVSIGTGQSNTEKIIENNEKGAARACADYTYGGFDDWFLPSKAELDLMYTNLAEKGLGNFQNDCYWSSSEGSSIAWTQYMDDGYQCDEYYYDYYYVRPVRAF